MKPLGQRFVVLCFARKSQSGRNLGPGICNCPRRGQLQTHIQRPGMPPESSSYPALTPSASAGF